MNRWVERVRKYSWAQLLLVAITSGLISSVVFAILGVYSCDAIVMYLSHGKETELGSAVLAIYTFLAFGTTGFVAVVLNHLWHRTTTGILSCHNHVYWCLH